MNNDNIESSAGVLVDWGTTNLRAYLVNNSGEIIDSRRGPHGIRNVSDKKFLHTIEDVLKGWNPTCPVLMSGMIGSAQGWHEAPYASCPSSADDIASGLMEIPENSRFSIVPGAMYQAPDGAFDVMRGEEVQIFGALDLSRSKDAILCLPGTHSKWATVKGGVLERFHTSMTGEVYSILKEHSILGALMNDGTDDDEAFKKGLERSGAEGGLLHHLFSTRTEGLFGRIEPEGLPSYMSGILIGNELRNFAPNTPSEETVLLVSDGVLGQKYMSAFDFFGISAQLVSAEDATVRGLSILQQIAVTKGKT